jgi:dihydropteroate synthase
MPHTDLHLGSSSFGPEARLVMAIVNRTPDSFFDGGANVADDAALAAVDVAVAQGAQIIDIGGVKAGPGNPVDTAEEIRRTIGLVEEVRERHPGVIISIDTWRAEVGELACRAGADLLNDAWGGFDPALAEVAAAHGVGLVCTHAGGQAPRTRPHRVEYSDVVAAIIADTIGQAERAVALGVDPARILIDPGHDFGKNTRHSLEATRRLGQLVDTGWPVLVSLSRKDFVGESLGRAAPADRLTGTLAATALSAWLGARVFRAHDVDATRQTIDMISTIAGDRAPVWTRRALA